MTVNYTRDLTCDHAVYKVLTLSWPMALTSSRRACRGTMHWGEAAASTPTSIALMARFHMLHRKKRMFTGLCEHREISLGEKGGCLDNKGVTCMEWRKVWAINKLLGMQSCGRLPGGAIRTAGGTALVVPAKGVGDEGRKARRGHHGSWTSLKSLRSSIKARSLRGADLRQTALVVPRWCRPNDLEAGRGGGNSRMRQ